mgnify:CR=1 FL=1
MADLTTVARVKTFLDISGSSLDTILGTLLNGASEAMQSYMDRRIPQAAYTGEKLSGSGFTSALCLRHYPVASSPALVLTLNGSTVDSSLYDLDLDTGMIHRVSSAAAAWLTDAEDGVPSWPRGKRIYSAAYTAGYATVPEDLQNAAIRQTALEFKRSKPGGDRIGLAGTTLDVAQGQYLTGPWAEGVQAVMDRYRRVL